MWVSFLYGGWLGTIVFWLAGASVAPSLQIVSWIAAFASCVLALVGYARLMARTPINAPNVEDGVLDERLVQVRDAAMRNAYRLLYVIGTLAGAALFVLILTNPLGASKAFTPNRTFFAYVVLLSAVLLPLVLPTTLIAWTSPDPPDDDDAP